MKRTIEEIIARLKELQQDDDIEEAKVSGITPSTGDTGQGGKPTKWFVTELGLYNILSQSRKPIARKWRTTFSSIKRLEGLWS